jgi:protein-S-isoprenylcysteine O-methyltransferase Ste14
VLTLARAELILCWAGFFYPFLFRAPHWQKRPSVVAAGPSRAGILAETLAVFLAFFFRPPAETPPGAARIAAAVLLAPLGPVVAWTAVTHLGRQFRLQAGLWEDHELVRSGPYALVRHPIYAALFAMLIATLLLYTRSPWWAVSAAVFLAGTEIRVRTEDGLLASRFGDAFAAYRRRVKAYIPLVR